MLRNSARKFELKLPLSILLTLVNLENLVRRTGTRIQKAGSEGLFKVQDNEYTLYFCRLERILLYARGLTYRLNSLAEIYHIEHLNLTQDTIFLDCGANVGELSLFVSKKYQCEIIAVEPEESELNCLRKNLHFTKAEIISGVLWSETTELDLYSKPSSADSSVIPGFFYENIKKVKAYTIDEIFQKIPPDKKTVLKIEAEGAEPEVLMGGFNTIKFCKFIVIDGGPERGPEKDRTETMNDNLLEKISDFQKTKVNFRTQLYENRK